MKANTKIERIFVLPDFITMESVTFFEDGTIQSIQYRKPEQILFFTENLDIKLDETRQVSAILTQN